MTFCYKEVCCQPKSDYFVSLPVTSLLDFNCPIGKELSEAVWRGYEPDNYSLTSGLSSPLLLLRTIKIFDQTYLVHKQYENNSIL